MEKKSCDTCGIRGDAGVYIRTARLEEIDVEEMVELNFIPSTVSEELWILHICDNECSEEGFKFYQLAAVV